MTAEGQPAASTTPSTRSRPNIVGWATGFACSQLADHIFALAIAWAAIQHGSPAAVGGVIGAASIPRIIILLFGGALADRINAKAMIAIADGLRAVALAVAAGLLLVGTGSIGFLIALSLVIGIADGLFQPAVGALSTRIVAADQMGRIAALRTTVSRLCLLAGGPISGVVLAWSGAAAAFALAAVLFVGSVAALLLIKVQQKRSAAVAPASLLRDIWDGLRAVKAHPTLPWVLILLGGMNFGFSGPVTAGIPLLAHQLSWGPATAGLIYGAFGCGAGLAGFSLVFLRQIPRAGWVILVSATAMTVALAGFSIVAAPAMAIAAAGLLGIASGVFGTTATGLVMAATPKTDIGRVMSLNALVLEAVVPVSLSLSGLLAAAATPAATFAAGAVPMAIAVCMSAVRRPLRTAQL